MARKNKIADQEITIRQDVVRSGAVGQSFDLMLKFTDNITQPELYMDELVKLVIEGLIAQYGSIIVQVNWWSSGLTVIAPTTLPTQDFVDDREAP